MCCLGARTVDAGGLAGSENFPLFRPDHSPRDTLGRTRAPRPGSPDVRSALALGCSSAATRRLPFALHLGLATAATDNCGTPLQHGTARDKVAEPKIAREAKLQTKSQGEDLLQKQRRRRKTQPGDRKKTPPGRAEPKSRAKMLGPSGEFVELCVSGARRLQRDLLPSRRRPAAPSAAPEAPGRPHLTQARAALQHHVGEIKAGRLDLEAGLRPAPLLVLPARREHVAAQGRPRGPGLLLHRGGRRAVCEVAACVEIKISRRVRPLIFTQVAADQRPAG